MVVNNIPIFFLVTLAGGLLLALSLYFLIFSKKNYIILLVYLEVGVLGIFLLFGGLSLLFFDYILHAYLLIFLCMAAIDSICGLVLILLFYNRIK